MVVRAVKAYAGEGDSVVYEMEDGRRQVRRGGTRAWRNLNPGNIRYVKANAWKGQVGEAGGFCVFEDEMWGRRAARMILARYAAKGLTLGQAIARYAPASENDVEAYVKAVQAAARVGAAIRLESLDRDAWDRVMEGIFRHEGWRCGTVTRNL